MVGAIGVFLAYFVPFFAYPVGGALIDNDPELAVDILKWNLTHFPGSQGPHVECVRHDIKSPRAEKLKQRAMEIGQELEERYGHSLTGSTNVSVVDSLGEHHGLTHYMGVENCIQIILNSNDPEYVIRHEWAHIAAERVTPSPAHGPTWRRIAEDFGVWGTRRYRHCKTGDYECAPRGRY